MRPVSKLLVATALLAATGTVGAPAFAQEPAAPATATGKGIAGFALIGGSAVMLTEAAFGVQPWWAYLAGGLGGAVAGGVGGYFFEDAADPKLSMASLFLGTALIIPTTVIVLSTTTSTPPPPPEEEEPKAEPARGGDARTEAKAKVAARRLQHRRATGGEFATRTLTPPSLLALSARGLSLGVPAPEARPVFSQLQLAQFGMPQATELRFPVLRATF